MTAGFGLVYAAIVLVASVVGWSESGKTTLIARLVAAWRARGRRVVVVKKGHGEPRLPSDGKDTSRFMAAGAEATYLQSGGALLRWQPEPPDLWAAIVSELAGTDVVLAEGLVVAGAPVVEVVRTDRPTGLKYPPADLAVVVGDRDPGVGVFFIPSGDLDGLIGFLEGWHES